MDDIFKILGLSNSYSQLPQGPREPYSNQPGKVFNAYKCRPMVNNKTDGEAPFNSFKGNGSDSQGR